jgi:excisionase family DNA binding protein
MDSQTEQPVCTGRQVEFFNTEELAAYLNVSKKFVIKHRDAGRIPGACRIGRIWRFRRSDVEKKLLSGELLLSKD